MSKKLTTLEKAWRRWKRTHDYRHALEWMGKPDVAEGTLWGAFCAGVLSIDPKADELAASRRRTR